jgi:UDP-N-acetylmuramoyl-tripeptide--D-alanyl-D-alanine ligase
MISFQLSEIAQALRGRVIGEDVEVHSISTDSRTLNEGDMYIALVGSCFDGHTYVEPARHKGAVAGMVSRPVETGLPCVEVADTHVGLGQLAAIWRRRSSAKVVGITGSNGKTTVKEMLAAILSRMGRTLATRGNFNNDIGMPLTLCRLQDETYAVIEMGANHPGEINHLSRIAQPDVAVLNNAGRAHLEGFGDVHGVAKAKAEILNGLPEQGVFVFNADDDFADLWKALGGSHKTRTFGVENAADVSSPKHALKLIWNAEGFHSEFPVLTSDGEFAVRLALAGEHNRMNALAAVAAAQVLGAGIDDVVDGLASLLPVPGRLCPRKGVSSSWLIDDSYNANPDSVVKALAVLAEAPGRKILVLGDLGELGRDAGSLHEELGGQAAEYGVDLLFSYGELSQAASRVFGSGAQHFSDQAALIADLQKELQEGDVVLIKGSRAAAMEKIVTALSAGVLPC